jgi:hypothetical protein
LILSRLGRLSEARVEFKAVLDRSNSAEFRKLYPRAVYAWAKEEVLHGNTSERIVALALEVLASNHTHEHGLLYRLLKDAIKAP